MKKVSNVHLGIGENKKMAERKDHNLTFVIYSIIFRFEHWNAITVEEVRIDLLNIANAYDELNNG